MGVDEIIEEFRGTLKTKIVDLSKNYISLISEQVVVFKNSEDMECNGNSISKGTVITSLKYGFNFNGDHELNEKAVYTGCSGDISLIEDVITTGDNLKPLPFNDFIRGKRSFDLQDNEQSRLYKVSNLEGEEIFKVFVEKKGNTKFAVFYYVGQKFLTINYEYNSSSTRAIFTAYSYNASYVRKHGRWNSRSTYAPVSFSAFVNKFSADQVVYLDANGARLSLSNFLGMFDNYVLQSTVSNLQSIFDYHNYYFPSTEATKSGAASQRLLEELRVAQTRLLTNSEINLVKNFVQNLINAAEAGQLIDNRPREQ
jgi:hypothetical protein